MRRGQGLALVLLTLMACGKASPSGSHPQQLEAVKLILDAHCASCHGPQKQRGGLRLDSDAALAALVNVAHPDESKLLRRIAGLDGEEQMPLEAAPLPPQDVQRIREWIVDGAKGLAAPPTSSHHWAYQPLQEPIVPQVARLAYPHPIDAFLRAGGVDMEPPLPPRALARRLWLDLVGLPPTPEELDAFEHEPSEAGYEALVDRLLASPAYGERWAVPWLDAVRYADTNGFEKDARRSAWPYRDWVIAALNDDMPFDVFTRAQIAGDLEGGMAVATGFLRASMHNEEGGVDPEAARFEALVDRTSTLATVWLGSTMGCARCHDHKHDPFTQADFYGLLALFEATRDDVLDLPEDHERDRLLRLKSELAKARKALNAEPSGATLRTWLTSLPDSSAAWETITIVGVKGEGEWTTQQGNVLIKSTRDGAQRWSFTFKLPGGVTGVRLLALPDKQLPDGGPGRGQGGNFFVEGLQVEHAVASQPWRKIPLARVASDDVPREEPERNAAMNLLVSATDTTFDGARGWGVFAAYDGAKHFARQLIIEPKQPIQGGRIRVRLSYGATGVAEVIGRLRFSVTRSHEPQTAIKIPARVRHLAPLTSTWAPDDVKLLRETFRQQAMDAAPLREHIARLQHEISAMGLVSSLVVSQAPGVAATAVRKRGAFDQRGDVVSPAVPKSLTGGKPEPLRDRLGLARWLTSRSNPLTARVTVNRIWAQHMGQGLVASLDDFGAHGGRPQNQPLLDWLAHTFMASGWSQKALHRLIVTSQAYRQGPGRGQTQPFAGLPALPLEAEVVRDSALAAAGQLVPTLGGPPVFPPQPPGYWAPPNSHDSVWPQTEGADSHRRSVYTFWRRTSPYPTLALLGAPTRETCVVERPRHIVPLQALVTLNDPGLWEAAGALAKRARVEAGARWIGRAFALVVGRDPVTEELLRLTSLYNRQHMRLQPRGATDPAATLVANTIMNLAPALSRN